MKVMKATRADLAGIKLVHDYFAYRLMPTSAPTFVTRALMEEAQASEVGADAVEELRAIAHHIRETGVVLPAEANNDPCDRALAELLQIIEDRIAALSIPPV